MTMKAITIWQPWAQLIAIRAKKFETRSRPFGYRGLIAIHAGAKRFSHVNLMELPTDVGTAIAREVYGALDELPYGAIIATAKLVGCWPTSSHLFHVSEDERLFGDWTPGRYALEIAEVKMLGKPIPAKGRQGLWNWKDDAI